MWRTLLIFGTFHAVQSHWSSFVTDLEKRDLTSKKGQKKSRDELLHEVLREQHPMGREKEINLEDFLWTGSGDSGDYPSYPDVPSNDSPTFAPPSPHPSEDPPSSHPLLTLYGSSHKLPNEEFLVRTILLSNMTVIHNGIEAFREDMEDKLTGAYRQAYALSRFRREVDLDVGRPPAKSLEPEEVARLFVRSPQADDEKQQQQEEEIEGSGVGTSQPTVKIHNIRSSLPQPEIEMIYTVTRDNEMIPADTAASALNRVSDADVALVLGFPLITKAEPYKARAMALVQQQSSSTSPQMTTWLIAAVVVSTLLALVILTALLFLLHRYRAEGNRHRRLMTSPGPSTSQDSNASGGRRGSIGSGTLDPSAFSLAKPGLEKDPHAAKATSRHAFLSSGQGFGASAKDGRTLPTISARSELISSGEELFKPKDAHSRNSSLLGEESPSLADLSSNNTPETHRRAKKPSKKPSRDRQQSKQKSKKVGTTKDEVDQSAFPVKTPDREGFLGPLSDLLEEEINLPGESREQSARPGVKGWTHLPKMRKSPSTSTSSPSSSCSSLCHREDNNDLSAMISPTSLAVGLDDEEEEEDNESTSAKPAGKGHPAHPAHPAHTAHPAHSAHSAHPALSPTDPCPEPQQQRAISAKSHIFRKGKVDAARPANTVRGTSQPRPWSAHESRLHSDPIFAMRQRHWEGLAQGKKTLHRGQLLPGSTSEEELREQLKQKPPQTCWSECTSPRKQVRIQEPLPVFDRSSSCQTGPGSSGQAGQAGPGSSGQKYPSAPIIQAIRVELQKFQSPKLPNLTGISVISDPDILKKESDA